MSDLCGIALPALSFDGRRRSSGREKAPYCRMVHSIDGEPQQERNDALNDALAAAHAGIADGYQCLFSSLARPVAGYIRARGIADPDGLTNEVFLLAFRT